MFFSSKQRVDIYWSVLKIPCCRTPSTEAQSIGRDKSINRSWIWCLAIHILPPFIVVLLVHRRCSIRQKKDRPGGRESSRPMFHPIRSVFRRNLTNAPDNQGMQSATSQTDASSSQITRHITKRQATPLQHGVFIAEGGCTALVLCRVCSGLIYIGPVFGLSFYACLSLCLFVGMSLT